MILSGFGLYFKELDEENIDLLRRWRNHSNNRLKMEFRDIITPEAQRVWFKNLNSENSKYFVILDGEKKIGVVNVKNIDFRSGSGEAGIIMGSNESRDSIIPLLAIYFLMDYAFDVLKLDFLKAKVMKSNVEALRLNEYLGYSVLTENSNDFHVLSCSKSCYDKATLTDRQVFYRQNMGIKV